MTQVTWSNDRGGSGIADGTTSWWIDALLQIGTNVITVTARDAAGHTSTDTIAVTYSDVTAPGLAITAPTAAATHATGASTITLAGTASDDVAVAQVTWSNHRGGSGTASGTTSWSASVPLQLGVNVLTVTVRDSSNNTNTRTLTVTCNDATAPSLAITSPTSASTYSTTSATLAIGGTAGDAVGVTQVTWSIGDDEVVGTASGTTSWSASLPLRPGTNIVAVTAHDAAGNTTSRTLTVTFTDVTAPVVTITSPTSATTASASVWSFALGGTASDNVGVTQVTWSNSRGGIDHAAGTANWTAMVGLYPGQNVITVTARDGANNTATDTITIAYTPFGPVSPAGTVTTRTPAFTWNATTAAAAYAVWVDDVQIQPWTTPAAAGCASGHGACSVSPGVTLPLDASAWAVAYRTAGGSEIWSDPQPFALQDVVAPAIAITGPTAAASHATTVAALTLSGTASDTWGLSHVTWSTDRGGSGTASGTSAWSASLPLYPGVTVVTVTAHDTGANTATDTVTVTYTPFGLVSPGGAITTRTPTYTWRASGIALAYTLTVDDASGDARIDTTVTPAQAGCASGVGLCSLTPAVPLALGAAAWRVDVDAGGGTLSDGPLAFSVDDTAPPAIAITAPTTGTSYATTTAAVTLGGTASDDLGLAQVTWSNHRGGSGTASGTDAWSATVPLQPGTNVLTVTARDVANRTATATLTVTFTDAVAPSISVTSPPPATTAAVSVTIAGTASDNIALARVTWRNDRGGSGIATGTSSWVADVPVHAGVNVVTLTAHDTAGHTASAVATVTATAAPPGGFGPLSPAGTTGTRTPTFRWHPSPLAALYRLWVDDATVEGVIRLELTPAEAGCAGAAALCAVSPGVALAVGPGQWWVGMVSAGGNGSWADGLEFVVQDIAPDTTAPAVTIASPTTAPTFDTFAPAVALAGAASDTESPIVAVSWSNDRGGAGTAAGTDAWAIAAVPLRVGPNVLTVTARDEAGNTAAATLTVTYTDRPPVIAPPGDQSAAEGAEVVLPIVASDPDGAPPLIYGAIDLPPGLYIDASTGVIAGTVAASSAGPYGVTVTAADANNTAVASFTWVVTPAPYVTQVLDTFFADTSSLFDHQIDVAPAGLTWRDLGGGRVPALQGGVVASEGYLHDLATVDVGVSDVVLTVRAVGAGGGLIFRAVDPRHYLFLKIDSDGPKLLRVVNDVEEFIRKSEQAIGAAEPHDLEVRAYGEHIRVYMDGTFRFEQRVPFWKGTRHGLRWPRRGMTFDDFALTSHRPMPDWWRDGCVSGITPTAATHSYAEQVGGELDGAIAVTVRPDAPECVWGADRTNAFVAITGGSPGVGDGAVTYHVETNHTVETRSASFLVGSRPFTVTQTPAPCQVTVDPVSDFGHAHYKEATQGFIRVATTNGCLWAITNLATLPDWLTIRGIVPVYITGETPGLIHEIRYELTDNDTGALRAHWLRFANQEYWIYQRHQPSPCGVVATPAEVRVGAGGGSATIAVVAACDWEATPNHGFIRVVAGATGSGTGTVTITVGPNASGGERVGELFIGSTLVPVRQRSLQLGSATVTYMHTDALGSVRLTTDATGTEVARYHFQPFGADVPGLPATGVGQPVLFTGKERDPETAGGGGTALDYFGARYYQSQTGRFTSVDPVVPIEDALLDPQRWNRYAYALNNPLKYTDPDGRCPACLLMLQRYGSQALQLASRYGTAAYNWTTRFFNSPVGQEVSATAAEIITGAQLPHGFSNAAQLQRFGSSLNTELSDIAGKGAQAFLTGSAVTGKSFATGAVFDVGRTSDFDVALVAGNLLAKARDLGIELRGKGTRTGPLRPRDLKALGLDQLAQQLSDMAGRPVHFMIYESEEVLRARRVDYYGF